MALKIKTQLSNKKNYGGTRNLSSIKYLVYHYTANDGDSDEGNANYFRNNIVNASAHYFVDNDSVTQSVPDNYTAWSVGGNKYPSAASTGGAKFYGKCTNSDSISIELCDSVKNGRYDFTANTLNLATELGKIIMKKYNIPLGNVIRHFDVTGKICPKPFVDDAAAWNKFKMRLVDDEMVESSKVIVNGKEIPVSRIMKDGSNYIKIRDVASALGYNITNKGDLAVLTKK